MDLDNYKKYVERFNNADAGAFDDYMLADVLMVNGALEMHGVREVKEHYQRNIWPNFAETVHIERFVSDGETLAIRMWTHFVALEASQTVFGAVNRGDAFDYRGLVMYDIAPDGRFSRVQVSYNSFTRTARDGTPTELGMPH